MLVFEPYSPTTLTGWISASQSKTGISFSDGQTGQTWRSGAGRCGWTKPFYLRKVEEEDSLKRVIMAAHEIALSHHSRSWSRCGRLWRTCVLRLVCLNRSGWRERRMLDTAYLCVCIPRIESENINVKLTSRYQGSALSITRSVLHGTRRR